MVTTSKGSRLTDREIYYYRQRQKNRIFQSVAAFFAEQAERYGLTKSAIANSLGKDRAQITRWLSGPGNWELDTLSDFLLAMGAEMDHAIVSLNEPDERDSTVVTILPPITVKRAAQQTTRTWPIVSKVASSP